MRRCRLIAFSLLSAAALVMSAGCGDSSTGGEGGGPATVPDATVGGFEETSPPADASTGGEDAALPQPGNEKIDFLLEKGDDGKQCRGTDRCAVFMSFNGQRDLNVAVTRKGTPVSDVQVNWEITKNKNNSLQLASKVSFTAADGKTANFAKQNAAQEFQYEVKVTVKDSGAAPIYFDVVVTPKGTVPLVVSYSYDGSRSFTGVTTYLYKNESPQKALKCADLDPANLPPADVSGSPKALSQTTAFSTLPGLQAEGTQHYTIVGVAKDGQGHVLAWGCDEKNGLVTYVGSAQVDIKLVDLPPRWKGKYDVTTNFDLVSLLPPKAETAVNIILGLFDDPPGQLLVLLCQFAGDVAVVDDLCGFVFQDPANPCLDNGCFESIGLAAKNLLNAWLQDLLKDNIGGDILFTGKDVSKILKELELLATVEFKDEPMADGTITEQIASIEWHTIRFRWTYGQNCNPGDPKDCWKQFSINALPGQAGTIKGFFSGKAEYKGNDNFLHIDEFPLNLKYGALLNFIVQSQLLPLIAGDGSNGGVNIDTYGKFLKSMLGGKECLTWENDPSIDNTCCDQFANDLSSQGLAQDIAKAACTAGIPVLEQKLNETFNNLDLDTGDGFTLQTEAVGCQCYDHDANMTIDTWGSLETPCKWITTLKLGSGTPKTLDNTFMAHEQQ